MLKSRRRVGSSLAVFGALLGAVPVLAANVVVSKNVDLVADRGTNGPVFFSFFPPERTRFTLSEGDTFTFNFNFSNSGSLTFKNIGAIYSFFVSPGFGPGEPIPVTGFTLTSSASLLDRFGNEFRTSDPFTQIFPGQSDFYPPISTFAPAQNFPPDFLVGTNRFYGVRITGRLDSFTNPLASNLPYAASILTIGLNDVQSRVPEPSSWAMMIAGFGAIGVGFRRRVVKKPDAFPA